MSDTDHVTFRIGGKMDRALLPALVHLLEQYGFDLDDNSEASAEGIELYLEATSRYLTLENPECHNENPKLRNWCQEHGLPYYRTRSGDFDYAPEIAWWVPGMDGERFQDTGIDREPVMPVGDLHQLVKLYPDDLLGGCKAYLAAHRPADIPPFELSTPVAVPF